jgi:hypothetical protein
MAALTGPRDTPKMQGGAFPDILAYPVLANAIPKQGGIVCLTAAGFATPGAVATTLRTVGIAVQPVDATGLASGDVQVECFQGIARLGNSSAGDLIVQADVGLDCYIVDDQTVAKTNGTSTRSVCGKVVAVDASGVWVRVNAP